MIHETSFFGAKTNFRYKNSSFVRHIMKTIYVFVIDSIFEPQNICFGFEISGLLDHSYNKCALVIFWPGEVWYTPKKATENEKSFPALSLHSYRPYSKASKICWVDFIGSSTDLFNAVSSTFGFKISLLKRSSVCCVGFDNFWGETTIIYVPMRITAGGF